jgi:hypothetical protein
MVLVGILLLQSRNQAIFLLKNLDEKNDYIADRKPSIDEMAS